MIYFYISVLVPYLLHATSVLCSYLFSFVGGDANASTAEAKEQVDARSVYVGNVRFPNLSLTHAWLVAAHMPNVGSVL